MWVVSLHFCKTCPKLQQPTETSTDAVPHLLAMRLRMTCALQLTPYRRKQCAGNIKRNVGSISIPWEVDGCHERVLSRHKHLCIFAWKDAWLDPNANTPCPKHPMLDGDLHVPGCQDPHSTGALRCRGRWFSKLVGSHCLPGILFLIAWLVIKWTWYCDIVQNCITDYDSWWCKMTT